MFAVCAIGASGTCLTACLTCRLFPVISAPPSSALQTGRHQLTNPTPSATVAGMNATTLQPLIDFRIAVGTSSEAIGWWTTFCVVDKADDREIVVAVPEQGGRGAISQDALAPGTVYTAFADGDSRVGLLRVEVATAPGTGKLRTPSSMGRNLKESLQRAWGLVQSSKDRIGLTPILAQKDVMVEAVDLSGGGADGEAGVAFYVAMLSALWDRKMQAGTVVLGDVTVQGNVKGVPSLAEPVQVSLDNGALRVLVPLANKAQIAGLSEDAVENLDLVFYGDVDRAVGKAVVG